MTPRVQPKPQPQPQPTALVGYRVARVVSDVFSPPVLAVVIAVLGALLVAQPGAWRFVLVFVGVGILAPIFDVIWLLRTGRISDFHLTKRSERIRPFVVSTAATTLAMVILWALGAPALLIWLAVAALAQTLLLFVLTLRWKVSIHAATSGAFAALVTLAWGIRPATGLVVLLIPVVGWARIHLRRHTLAQVVVGATIGAVTMAVAMRGLLWE